MSPDRRLWRASSAHGTTETVDSSSGGASSIDAIVRRRLAAAALLYSLCYFFAFGIPVLQDYVEDGWWSPRLSAFVVAGVAIALGLVVFVVARRGLLPAARLGTLALVFEVVASLGIVGGMWGWESDSDRHFYAAYRTFEGVFETGEAVPAETRAEYFNTEPTPEQRSAFHDRYIDPLVNMNMRLLRVEGVSWIGVWILMFPLILPAPPRRILLSSFAAATLPFIYLVSSPLINGVPYSLHAWIVPFIAEFFVPIYLCVGIAYFSARVLHGLHRNLSKAQRLGSYELVEQIGQGGMGEVWRARHRMLARPAAIKLIKPEAFTTEGTGDAITALRQFEREAQATAALGSPHSVELYDFGVTREGTFYYVMELLNGLDLRTLVERYGPLPAERAVHLMRQTCHSLSDAHLSGLLHRDVKPANIYACRRGHDFDFVKVLDFGLVKELGSRGGDTQLTVEGVASGTPAFMAPEIAAGGAPDARADLYSLGCAMYWLVTGQLVFDGTTPVAVIMQHMQTTPVLPSERTELGIPPSLDALVMACLAKDPTLRPASARALVTALDEVAAELDPWTAERAEKWWLTTLPEIASGTPPELETVAATLPVQP